MKPLLHPRRLALLLLAASLLPRPAISSEYIPPGSGVPESSRGVYFAKKHYAPEPLPTFAEARDKLPSPVMDSRPELVAMYWKCWELAFRNMKQPPPGSPFVSNWIDPAFNHNIFEWDSVFILMFARYGNEAFPAIQTLDNFYCRQRANGFIGREIHRSDGLETFVDGPKDAVNPPLQLGGGRILSVTGDKSRFAMVLPPLEHYVAWLNRDGDPVSANGTDWQDHGRRAEGSVHHLYWNTPLGSGMDNAPRHGNGWVDMSCQMVIQYDNLATICDELSLSAKAAGYRAEARAIAGRINRWCWNEQDGFYYDVDNDGTQFRVKTAGGFWPMVAGVADPRQTARLVAHLRNKREFWRPFVFPTLAADDPHYQGDGGYWLGGVWAPTNFVIIKGLERSGQEDFATEATDRYLTAMAEVFKETGTVWEDYAPEAPLRPGNPSKRDLVGWTGDGPIALLIENMLGFRSDGVRHRLTWRVTRTDRHGIERLHVGPVTVSAVCAARPSSSSPAALEVSNDGPLDLNVWNHGRERTFSLPPGRHWLAVE